jgi:uncharacterized protein (TIGR00730 family)
MNGKESEVKHSGNVSLSDEEAVKDVLVRSVLGLWDVVNELTRLRPSKQDRYRVTIFGSARAKKGSAGYDKVQALAAALAGLDCDIVTGGGPGLMQAANEGAASAGNPGAHRSVGIRVDLPFEQDVNPFVTHAYEHKTFFTRLHHFVLASNAFVVVPGGIGTLLELTMVWQLLQVRHIRDTPIILVGKMWPPLLAWAREEMLNTDHPLASPSDMDIPRCVMTAEEAIEIVRAHRATWANPAP